MAQLTANSPQVFILPFNLTNACPVDASKEIFLGSAVGVQTSNGYCRQLVAGDIFIGFAEQHINNSTGAAGALTVPLMREGRVQLNVSGAAITDIGKAVYASDGATFTYTATSNTRIGTVVRWISTGVVIVEFWTSTSKLLYTAITDNSTGVASATFAAITAASTLTDSTGGTAATTFAAITAGAGYAQADMVAVKNALSQSVLNFNALNAELTAVRNAIAQIAADLNVLNQAGL